MAFHPYLFFGGSCREAFTRYHEIFGGELQIVTNADMPGDERMPGADDDVVVHAAIVIGGDLLMASDDPTDDFGPVQGMQVNASLPSLDQAKQAFEALAEGGQVTMPMGATSWSPGFGMCTDRFGTPWMISVDAPA